MAYNAGLRSGVGATHRGHGLGAVPLRPLGLGGAVGLDVDRRRAVGLRAVSLRPLGVRGRRLGDRKSTRLNSSHPSISYAVFCLKKKKKNKYHSEIRHEERTQNKD